MLGLFVGFLGYLYVLSRYSNRDACEIKQIGCTKIVSYTVLGMLALVLGSNITVDAAKNIAEYFGVSERIIGLTIIAIGTSLPELVTSIIASRKGECDLAIGNIVGSNIFNILFVLGLSGVILPIPFNPAFTIDCWIAILSVVMLALATFRTGRMGGNIHSNLYCVYDLFNKITLPIIIRKIESSAWGQSSCVFYLLRLLPFGAIFLYVQ